MAPSRCFKDLFWADSKPLTLICLIWNSSLILLQTCSKCNWASDPPHRPVPALLQWCSLSHCEGCWQWYLLSGVLPNESLWAEVKPCLGQADSYEWIFLPTSRTVLPTFQTFYPDGVHFAQTVVHFAHFQNQARKRGVLGWGWECFLFINIPERGLWRLSIDQGFMVVFWAKWDPILAKWDQSWQIVLKWAKVL